MGDIDRIHNVTPSHFGQTPHHAVQGTPDRRQRHKQGGKHEEDILELTNDTPEELPPHAPEQPPTPPGLDLTI